MSCEIVPFVEESDTSPSAEPDCTGKEGKAAVVVSGDSDAILRRRFGAMEEGIRPFDLSGLCPLKNHTESVKVDLIGGNHEMRYFLSPEKGPKCATRLNPTPESVKPLLDMVKEPSVLLLRGCDQLFSPAASPFPFEKFKTLTSLEISGCTHLTTLPENTISEMIQLQSLTLSHLPIQELTDGFFSKLTQLRSLVLQDCSNLLSLSKFPQLIALEYLELSYLLIETLSEGFFSDLQKLKRLILTGCSKLCSFPSIMPLKKKLEELDLSHCTALQAMEPIGFDKLWKLDLSYTALHFSSTIGHILWVTHLFLRDAKVIDFGGLELFSLKVLDVSGAQNVKDLDLLKDSKRLVALDLSRTGIEIIDFISGLVDLRYLILRECTKLNKLPTMEELTQLEVLDISRTLVEEVPNLANLINLKEFFFADCQKLKGVPEGLRTLTNLETLDLAPPGSGEIDFVEDPRRKFEGRLSKPSEFYLVSTLFSYSGFDQFRQRFDQIVGLISNFQQNLKPTSSVDNVPTAMIDADNCQAVKRHCTRMLADLEYIRDSIGLLESCRNCVSAEELLYNLMEWAPLYFQRHTIEFSKVLHTVAKLKLLVPPPKQVDDLLKKWDKRFKRHLRLFGHSQIDVPETDINNPEMQNLSRSYDSLTNIQKNCLLYFTLFPVTSIKERILIHLWYGEGFIDPQHEENVALSKADSTTIPQPTPTQNLNLDPTPYPNPNPEITSVSTEAGPTRNDALLVSTTIEEIGREILMVLEEKKFIERDEPWDRESRMWVMCVSAPSFVRARAKEERFFNFDEKNGKLTPHVRLGSQRACLVQSQDNLPSSCRLWATYINSSEKLARFKNIRALLNVNEVMIDIKEEWFSKMRNLRLLHLSRWVSRSEKPYMEVLDLKFLEELKNMKQLWVLSLEGFSTIKKLPNSVCKVTSLKILNLRDCSYLEELPVGIGSLKNLTHLDLTDCCILSNLPKGIRLLSKLEVLKGFVITYQIGGRQHPNACTLGELLKSEKLRKLTLVVNTDKFPDSQDLHVFNGMKNLCNLKITWQKNYNDLGTQPQGVVVGQKASRQCSKWLPLKCWKQQTRQDVDTGELLGSNLQKLELRCFPLETPPNWLRPSGLQKLEKLNILGGKLTTLLGDANQNTWNVKSLELRYLPNMYMDPEELRSNFPRMTHLGTWECDRFPHYRGKFNREENESSRNESFNSSRSEESDVQDDNKSDSNDGGKQCDAFNDDIDQ